MQSSTDTSTTNTLPDLGPSNAKFIAHLAFVSKSDKWVFFTNSCPKPDIHWLSKKDVDCSKVIYLKASSISDEIKVVMDAILSNNASAIVASDHIDTITQNQLISLGEQHDCFVSFIDNMYIRPLH